MMSFPTKILANRGESLTSDDARHVSSKLIVETFCTVSGTLDNSTETIVNLIYAMTLVLGC